MNVETIAQLSSSLSAQRNAVSVEAKVLKLANDQIEAEGQAGLQLIQALPQANGNVGNTINIAV